MTMGTRAVIASAALASVALAACQRQAPEPEAPAAPLPAVVCDKTGQALEKLGKSGGFEYDSQGVATINEASWFALSATDRDNLGRLLAFHVACASKEPSNEQNITIRNEYGRVLTRRIVETNVDLSEFLKE